jgi:phage baseplate assembly protein W
MDAVKFNVLNLCSTEMGERPMQPLLGVKLKQFLFEQYTDDLVFRVQDAVTRSLNYWLPFVKVNNIEVKMSDNQSADFRSTLEVTINFSLKKDPTTFESVQVAVNG